MALTAALHCWQQALGIPKWSQDGLAVMISPRDLEPPSWCSHQSLLLLFLFFLLLLCWPLVASQGGSWQARGQLHITPSTVRCCPWISPQLLPCCSPRSPSSAALPQAWPEGQPPGWGRNLAQEGREWLQALVAHQDRESNPAVTNKPWFCKTHAVNYECLSFYSNYSFPFVLKMQTKKIFFFTVRKSPFLVDWMLLTIFMINRFCVIAESKR